MESDRRRELRAGYKEQLSRREGGVAVIVNGATGSRHYISSRDIRGAENRFNFSRDTGSCTYAELAAEWREHGAKSFSFEVLETLSQKAGDTDARFDEELAALLEMYKNGEDK